MRQMLYKIGNIFYVSQNLRRNLPRFEHPNNIAILKNVNILDQKYAIYERNIFHSLKLQNQISEKPYTFLQCYSCYNLNFKWTTQFIKAWFYMLKTYGYIISTHSHILYMHMNFFKKSYLVCNNLQKTLDIAINQKKWNLPWISCKM